MKNILLILLIVGLHAATAQITLDSNDFPKAGDTPTYSTADTLLGIDLAVTGPNQNWDFSNLSPLAQTTDSFLSSSDLPFTLRFSIPSRVNAVSFINTPDSIPGVGVSLTGGYDLYAVTTGAYESLGQATVLGGLLPIVLEADPSDTIFALPLTYQDIGSGSSYAELDLNIPTVGDVYYEQSRDRNYVVDGWGQLTTPYGQFQVLRTRSTTQGSDSTNFTLAGGDPTAFRIPVPEQISYQWWAKNERAPILEISAAQLGGNEFVTQVRYRDSVRNLRPNSVDRQLTQVALSISPNPTTDIATIDWDMQGKTGYLEVFSMNGKRVYEDVLEKGSTQISLRNLESGAYFVRILELNGSRVFIGKIVKQE